MFLIKINSTKIYNKVHMIFEDNLFGYDISTRDDKIRSVNGEFVFALNPTESPFQRK